MSMSMSNHEEQDLDLLLSLQDRVLETPPASPSNPLSTSPASISFNLGNLSDDGSPRLREHCDLSAFKDVVQDCLDYQPKQPDKSTKLNQSKHSNEANVEKYSGLRLRDQLVTASELSERFSDIRFVRLPTIKNLGDTLTGCWATVGVLTEKGHPKTSSAGKSYCIWKIGCLDENTITLFLFGDAYQLNWKEPAGTVFALFNCNVRKDSMGAGFSLSVYSPNQILKMGTSVDYGVCKGKRKDGMACTIVINKRQGIYCKYHRSKASETFLTSRTELQGGNLRTAFRDPLRARGIYMVDPLANRTNLKKPTQPKKLLTVEALQKALSNGDRLTTDTHSQGIRILNQITGKMDSKSSGKVPAIPNQRKTSSEKRKSSSGQVDAPKIMKNQPDAKRKKTPEGKASVDKATQDSVKMIEIDVYGSDEEL